ncbi:MAG TPA: hypothetical protein VGM14_28965 [Streptosporangiaceae bacterium]
MRLPKLILSAMVVASGLVVVAAPAAAFASWLQQPTATLVSPDTWEFTAVSCTSPSICMAVGQVTAPSSQLLSETRSPSGWTVRPTLQPVVGSHFLSVSCTKASACTAVGESPAGLGSVPLAERWFGNGWVIQSAPAPAGATFSQLSGVSCISATKCLAVGFAQTGGSQKPLAELWNGSSWKIQATPKPAGQPLSELTGISCPSTSRCFAVGRFARKNAQKTLAETWNGKKWAIQKTPSPVKNDVLNAVSCRAANSCMAVGSGLAERWNGQSWSTQKIGKPSGSAADLTGVSCTKAGPCYAVGGNFRQAVQSSVAELWNGSKWSVQPVVLTTSSDPSLLDGVSCTTATNCTAAGFYDDPANGDRALAEDFSIRWQDVSPAPFIGTTAAGLNGVSCTSQNACLAVGTVQRGGAFQAISQTWNGTGWTARIMPRPKITHLFAVSCTTATACTAVGDIVTGTNSVPLAERWNGVHWTIQKIPHPPSAARNILASVSCPSKTSCFAVGATTNSSNQERTLAERWNGKTWQVTPTPNPARKTEIELTGVSCPAASSCVAVGSFLEGMFAQAWNGKTWKFTGAVPNPKNDIHGELNGVSCPATSDCMAVGETSANSSTVPLAERWNGKKWSPQRAVPPADAISSALVDVSCTSGNACAAVGLEQESAGVGAIAESWTGKRWVMHPIGVPVGSTNTILNHVSCNSAIACMAVGSFRDSSAVDQMLAEQYS